MCCYGMICVLAQRIRYRDPPHWGSFTSQVSEEKMEPPDLQTDRHSTRMHQTTAMRHSLLLLPQIHQSLHPRAQSEPLLCARHPSKQFTRIHSLHPLNSPVVPNAPGKILKFPVPKSRTEPIPIFVGRRHRFFFLKSPGVIPTCSKV